MGEVFFYHLTDTPLERTLPGLLEKSLQRGWRVQVRGGIRERLSWLDEYLWTYRDESFLPHGVSDAKDQPVFLTDTGGNPNGADVLMLIDGARVDVDEAKDFARICVLFDGNDGDACQAARADWKSVTKAGGAAVYWARENGRWEKKS